MLFPPASMQPVHDIALDGCITTEQTKTLMSSTDGMRRILTFFFNRWDATHPGCSDLPEYSGRSEEPVRDAWCDLQQDESP
jgi:hypothetical protein